MSRIEQTPTSESLMKTGGNNYANAVALESTWGEPGKIIIDLINRNVRKGDTVIDAPGGDARYGEILCEAVGENGRVINIDYDKDALQRTHQRFGGKYNDRLETFHADLTESLPPVFRDESIDALLCLGFMHLPHPDKIREVFIPEVIRILKPRGRFFGNFLVDVVRTDLNNGSILPTAEFAERAYTVEEGLAFLMDSFRNHDLTADIYRDLNFDYHDTHPSYHWNGTSIVFQVQKVSSAPIVQSIS